MFVAASFSSNVSTSLFVYSGALSSSLGTFFIGTGSISINHEQSLESRLENL